MANTVDTGALFFGEDANENPEPIRSTNGAARSHIAASDLTSFNEETSTITGVAGAADTNVIYTSGDISMYNYTIIENADDATAVDVYVSADGTNFNANAQKVFIQDEVTDELPEINIAAGKVGIIYGKFKAMKILQDGAGAIDAGDVRGFHGVK